MEGGILDWQNTAGILRDGACGKGESGQDNDPQSAV